MADSVDEAIFGLSAADPLDESTLAPLSCFICRKRKVKCSRQLPACSLCTRLSLDCAYPAESQKPGPKKGANQERKKRMRRDEHDHDLDSSQSSALAVPEQPPAVPQPSAFAEDLDFSWMLDPALDWGNVAPGPDPTTLLDGAQFAAHPGIVAPPKPASDPLTVHISKSLGIQPEECQTLFDLYFDSFGSFTLFNRPSFERKLLEIRHNDHLLALVAAMFAFSARFWTEATSGITTDAAGVRASSPDDFWILATYYVDKILAASGDNAPPLVVLQALILTTLYGLIRGASSATLQSSQVMVGVAVGLGLHQLDRHSRGQPLDAQRQVDPATWSAREEGRRAWWALWELDVFSSTCRRLPPEIDWYQNDVLLPADDDDWFHERPQPSAFLEIDPMKRCKSLEASGNESAKAWYICVNSLMHSAFFVPQSLRHAPHSVPRKDPNAERMRKEDYIWTTHLHSNALHCFSLALPKKLQYHGEFLTFDNSPLQGSSRQRDNGIYMIHLMTQFARFMMHHRTVFADIDEDGSQEENELSNFVTATKQSSRSRPWRLYLDTANNALAIIRNSPPNHIAYVNPLIALVVWLPAAVMQAYQIVGTGLSEREEKLVRSSFEMLRSTFTKYLDYWKLPSALFDRLKQLDGQFERLRDAKAHERAVKRSGQHLQQQQQASSPQSVYWNADGGTPSSAASPSGGDGTLPDELINKMANLETGYNPMLSGFLDDIFSLPAG